MVRTEFWGKFCLPQNCSETVFFCIFLKILSLVFLDINYNSYCYLYFTVNYWCKNGWVWSWGKFTLSLLPKLPPRKLEPWFVLWIFFLLRLLCISINLPYGHGWNYCCHVWAGASRCYLELLDKLQKWICKTVGPSLAASLEPLTHRRNVASLSLFYRCYYVRCSSELAQVVPPPCSQRKIYSLFW